MLLQLARLHVLLHRCTLSVLSVLPREPQILAQRAFKLPIKLRLPTVRSIELVEDFLISLDAFELTNYVGCRR